MSDVYIYSDVPSTASELVGFAKQNGKAAFLLAFSKDAAASLSSIGADKVCLFDGSSSAPEDYCKSVSTYLKENGAQLLLAEATVRGRDFAARVAASSGAAFSSDVSSVSFSDDSVLCERSLYGGAVIQQEILAGFSVVTVPAGKFEPANAGNCEIVTVSAQPDTRVEIVSTKPILRQGADLKAAEKVVSVGMGLEKVEDLQMVRDLAACLGAAIGCSRGVAEERHWLPVEQYVGISGCAIKPKLYFTMGISGQVQHLFGVRDAKLIVAIDTNEKAPIFKSADYGIVGDMYEIIPLLTKALG